MASSIASPIPLRMDRSRPMSNEVQSAEPGRDTPLPQYEKTQPQSVPFTLNLQEDARNPGQFQLVVNVGPKSALPLGLAPSHNAPVSMGDGLKPSFQVPTLYQTQKPSPPTTPHQDKQGWSDLDAVPPDFLQKVVPDWNLTFARSDSTASTQSKKLADIKARIKKKGKGYVVRLLKGTAADSNEIAEVELGQDCPALVDNKPQELDSSSLRAELDSTQDAFSTADESIFARHDLFEIGTSNELGTQRQQNATVLGRPPSGRSASGHFTGGDLARYSIAEEGLSDAETLIPEFRSIGGRLEDDRTDLESLFRGSSTHINRSNSASSIVKTPTRGLSVVGPVRRVEKSHKARSKSKASAMELKRSDAHKSVKHRSPRNSSSLATGNNFMQVSKNAPVVRERNRRVSREANELLLSPNENNTWHNPAREIQTGKPQHVRRSSTNDLSPSLTAKSKLRLQTNIPKTRSANASPITLRKKSPRIRTPVSPSSSSGSLVEDADNLCSSPEWSEADPSEELREALGRVLGAPSSENDGPEHTTYGRTLPLIVEPLEEHQVGEVPLPSEYEMRSAPVYSRSSTVMYWGLALSALSDKVYEGFQMLRKHYGAEPPVPPGHVRVRWTCPCGEALYDDYVEQRPNAARLFEAYLNRPRTHTPRSPTSQSSSASSMASIFDASSRASTLATPSSTYGGASSWGKGSDKSKYSPTRVRASNPFSVRMPTYVEESWLLTCANEGRLTPKIVHIDVNEGRIKSDKDLALALREHYDQLNRRWYNWARLRGLTTIEFVQFEVHRNRFADIRATPSMPPKSATSASTSPDSEKSRSPSQHPYTFEPNDLLPPVGSTYLLHLFQHPTDYDSELITYLRSPKRRARLEHGMGWGVHLVEGFLAQRVWAVTMGICGLGSAVFAIMWTIKKNDLQGAFGVAQWVLGLAVLLVGGLQAWLE